MGVAALILGIISIIIGFIPLCGAVAYLPALIGLILGIVDTVKKSKTGEKKGVSIAGIILSALAIIIISAWIFLFGAAISNMDVNELENLATTLNQYSTSSSYSYY